MLGDLPPCIDGTIRPVFRSSPCRKVQEMIQARGGYPPAYEAGTVR